MNQTAIKRSTEQGKRLCLASASPQRLALLAQLGFDCQPMPMHIDETRRQQEDARDYVHRLALGKARAASELIAAELPVLGADTTVLSGQLVMEKPADVEQASQMLRQLSGSTHQVFTGAAIVSPALEKSIVVATDVTFRNLSERDIQSYIATGEPFGKAGAYAIQGLGAAFVASITGSYSNVMGLPLFETAALLADFGIHVLDAR